LQTVCAGRALQLLQDAIGTFSDKFRLRGLVRVKLSFSHARGWPNLQPAVPQLAVGRQLGRHSVILMVLVRISVRTEYY